MPKKIILIVLCFTLIQAMFGLTIRQIQETTEPGSDNTYPSLHVGEEVTVNNVVIGAKGFNGSDDNVFIFTLESTFNEWNGLYLPNTTTTAGIGALVNVTGTVEEIDGVTAIPNANISIVNAGPYTLPIPRIKTLEEMSNNENAEKFESGLVAFENVICSETPNDNGQWLISNGSNDFPIDNSFYTLDPSPLVDQDWAKVSGLVFYANDEFELNPRDNDDFLNSTLATMAVSTSYTVAGKKLYVDVKANRIKPSWNLSTIEFVFNYTDDLITFDMLKADGTISEDGQVNYAFVEDNSNEIMVMIEDINVQSEVIDPVLVSMVFDLDEYGITSIDIDSFTSIDTDGNEFNATSLPTVSYNYSYTKKDAYLSIKNQNNNKNIINPDYHEKLTIKYGFKPGVSCRAIVRIYDIQGRLVHTPVNKIISGLDEFEWNGRDNHNEKLDLGVYICQVEVTVRDGGDKYVADQPIVIAGQLK